jgi:hypothetical protein
MGWRSPIELLFWAPLDGEAPIGQGDEWLSAGPDPSLAGEWRETPANVWIHRHSVLQRPADARDGVPIQADACCYGEAASVTFRASGPFSP